MSLDELEDMSEYEVGLWYSPFVKVYHIGGRNRIAEISTYPRAYKDTTPHVYTEDTPFIVTESDLNHEVDGEWFYMDSRENLFGIGEEATHWTGDPLPGAFPLWLESEDLPFTADPDEHIFTLDDVPAPIAELAEAGIQVGDSYIKLLPGALESIIDQLSSGQIVFAHKDGDSDKQIVRIRYRRVF